MIKNYLWKLGKIYFGKGILQGKNIYENLTL